MTPAGPAAFAGLAQGDLLQELDHQEVKSIADFGRIFKRLEKSRAAEVYVRVLRRRDVLVCRMEPRWGTTEGETPEEE